jgi:hypothetical protein
MAIFATASLMLDDSADVASSNSTPEQCEAKAPRTEIVFHTGASSLSATSMRVHFT